MVLARLQWFGDGLLKKKKGKSFILWSLEMSVDLHEVTEAASLRHSFLFEIAQPHLQLVRLRYRLDPDIKIEHCAEHHFGVQLRLAFNKATSQRPI